MYRKSTGWKRVITLDWKFFSPLPYAKTFLTSKHSLIYYPKMQLLVILFVIRLIAPINLFKNQNGFLKKKLPI